MFLQNKPSLYKIKNELLESYQSKVLTWLIDYVAKIDIPTVKSKINLECQFWFLNIPFVWLKNIT